MTGWKRAAVTGAAGGVGFAVTLSLIFAVMTWHRERLNSRNTKVPEKIIPAQDLRLVDQTGRVVGEIEVRGNGTTTLTLVDEAGYLIVRLVTHASGDSQAVIYGNQKHPLAKITIMMRPLPQFWLHLPGGQHHFAFSKDWRRPGGFPANIFFVAKQLAAEGYNSIFPPKPKTTVDEMVPTEDLRLLDKNKYGFAVLGLSTAGDPAIALTDSTGRLLACWALQERAWSDIALFDRTASMRVSIEIRPERVPNLMIFENDSTFQYALDPRTGEEAPFFGSRSGGSEPGAIDWLGTTHNKVTVPLALLDNRDKLIWRAP